MKGVEVGTPAGGQTRLPGGAVAGLVLGTVRGGLFLEGVAKVLHAGMGWDLEAREQGPFRLTREQRLELEAERREARLKQAERRLEAVRRLIRHRRGYPARRQSGPSDDPACAVWTGATPPNIPGSTDVSPVKRYLTELKESGDPRACSRSTRAC